MTTHGPIEDAQRKRMNEIAALLDTALNPDFNGDRDAREWGFVLLTFRFGAIEDGRMNYISNGPREDILAALKELIANFEGRMLPDARDQ